MLGVAESGEEEWDKMWDLYLAENDPQEKGKLRYALCAARDPWIISRYKSTLLCNSVARAKLFK